MRIWKLFALSAAVLAADFVSKNFVCRNFAAVAHNSGISFGLLNSSSRSVLLLNFVVAAGLALLPVCFAKREQKLEALGAALMFGGSLGNLCDRAMYGYVADWIPLPFSKVLFAGALMLNLADFAVILGFCLVLWGIMSDFMHISHK